MIAALACGGGAPDPCLLRTLGTEVRQLTNHPGIDGAAAFAPFP